jgi:hypothetical protein
VSLDIFDAIEVKAIKAKHFLCKDSPSQSQSERAKMLDNHGL